VARAAGAGIDPTPPDPRRLAEAREELGVSEPQFHALVTEVGARLEHTLRLYGE
jgi:hypothetical protein